MIAKPPELHCETVRIQVQDLSVHRPRQWGACWLALALWERLELDRFWSQRLLPSRQGTRWLEVLKTQVCYQLIEPGSGVASLPALVRAQRDGGLAEQSGEGHCRRHAVSLPGQAAGVISGRFFSFLRERWETLFEARFDVLLYDLTSTYFESDPPFSGKRQFGYSRDKRSDCVQVVIALVVTPEGVSAGLRGDAGQHQRQDDAGASFWQRSRRNTGGPIGSGSWTGVFRPRRRWRRCAGARRRCTTWSAPPRGV